MIYKSMRGNKVSAICYGGSSISKPEHISNLQCAIDNGVNFIDTSENYNNGNSEIIIGQAINKNRENIFLGTKVGPENLKYDDVINSCKMSLNRLQTNYIDLYYVHWPNSSIPIKETCSALLELKENLKLIKNIGFCNFNIQQLEEAYNILGDKILTIQSEYNLFERSVENDVMPFCLKHGIFFVAFSPLKWMKYSKYMDYDHSFILSWIISHQNVIVATSSLNNNHIEKSCNSKIIEIKEIEKVNTSSIDINLIEYDINKKASDIMDVLGEDVKRYGALKPIKVIKENNKYKIIDGTMRFLVWKYVYPDKPIEAIILKNNNE